MKKHCQRMIWSLLLICSWLWSISLAQTATESPKLVESRNLNAQVIKLYGEKKYDEALPVAKQALQLREEALGLEHPDLVPLLTNLGYLYEAKQKFSDARSVFDRALIVAEKIFGADDLRLAKILDELGYVAFQQHDDHKAIDFLTRSLIITKKAFGPENPEITLTAFSLAEIYRIDHEYEKAESLYQAVIRIREALNKKDDDELVRALESYLVMLFVQKRTDDAAQVQKKLGELLAQKGVVEGGVLNGKALKLAQPAYPMAARMDRASGSVHVRVLIDETGKVISAQAINAGSTNLALVNAAEDAARHSLFTPTVLSGVAVKVYGIIIYNFIAQ